MKVGALIPARISSKRLPKKNYLEINGKPLVCWTIDKALEADVFDNITISTDCKDARDQILDMYPSGVVEAVVRPDALSGYNTDLNDCIVHYLHTNPDIDVVGTLMPTYPFRKIATLRTIDAHIRSRYTWKVIGISTERYTTSDYFYSVESGVKRIFDSRALQCPITNGAYSYWHRNLFGGLWNNYPLTSNERVLHVSTTSEESIDIDTRHDFEIAEKIMSGATIVPKKCQEHSFGKWTIYVPVDLDINKFIAYVGEEQFEDQSHPLVVLKQVQHAYARFLKLSQFVGRCHFVNLEAYKHVVCPEGIVSHQSQSYPTEYRAVPSYRCLRIDNEEYTLSTQNTFPDLHGVDLGDMFGDRSSPEYTFLPNGTQLSPDVIPTRRIIQWEKLIEQDFFVDPIEFIYE